MLFSEEFEVINVRDKEWFDQILETDVELFIDPFLVNHTDNPYFVKAKDQIAKFFQKAFELVAIANKTKSKAVKQKALAMLEFPEVNEIGLGYSQFRKGAGSGGTYSKLLYNSISEYLSMGLKPEDTNQLETMSIFVEGIGPDRISDFTANILKPYLIKYTQDICKKHKIPMEKVGIENAKFDETDLEWHDEYVELPVNPYGGALLLVPKYFLRRLPTINDLEFENYLSSKESEILRSILDKEIAKNLDKNKLLRILKMKPDILKAFLDYANTSIKAKPYDVNKDEDLRWKWYLAGREVSKELSPIKTKIVDNKTLKTNLLEACSDFKNYIENKGYKVLWNDSGKPRKEDVVRNVFHLAMLLWCKENNISISPETDVGRGSVDFKFSRGDKIRAHLEVKLAKNKKLMQGVKIQLPLYLKGEKIKLGFFMIIILYEREILKTKNVTSLIGEINKNLKVDITPISIDARLDKPSASVAKSVS